MNKDFDKSKIFENLSYQEQPSSYKGKLSWIIQQQISATNGIHYAKEIGRLEDYPIPSIPIPTANKDSELFLDIGSGWGRWTVAAGRKKYLPIGLDLRLEFCKATLETMRACGVNGYVVSADLKKLPFQNNIFKAIWSFSVIQHTHETRMTSCIGEIKRILLPTGFAKLEFPNSKGIRNRFLHVDKSNARAADIDSWVVRYYSITQYKEFFKNYFSSISCEIHSLIGIGILPSDILFIKATKTRLKVAVSILLTFIAKLIPYSRYFADSLFFTLTNDGAELVKSECYQEFLQAHKANPSNNLNIIYLLKCPVTGESLHCSEDKQYIFNQSRTCRYEVIDNIPIIQDATVSMGQW